jgi:hypothetical protein
MIKKIIMVVCVFGLAPVAFGQGMGMGITQSFEDMDLDDDGSISKEELGKVIPAERVDNAFSRFDTDEDGKLSKEEFDNRPPPPGMGG